MCDMKVEKKDIQTVMLNFSNNIFRCMINAKGNLFKQIIILWTTCVITDIILCVLAHLLLTKDQFEHFAPKLFFTVIGIVTLLAGALLIMIVTNIRQTGVQPQVLAATESDV